MKLDLQAVNLKTGKVVSITYDIDNHTLLEDMIYEMSMDMTANIPGLTLAQREAIAKNIASESTEQKEAHKPRRRK